MKMPYKQDFIAALLASREQGIGAMLAFIMAYLRGRYNGGKLWKGIVDALMCAPGSYETCSILSAGVLIWPISAASLLVISEQTRSALCSKSSQPKKQG